MALWTIFTRRYSSRNRIVKIRAPGVVSPEAVLLEEEAINTQTQGYHERLGDFWLYVYVWEGEAYVLVQYHRGNRGLMVPPVALKDFERVIYEKGTGQFRLLGLFLGESYGWRFPYSVGSMEKGAYHDVANTGNMTFDPLFMADAEAGDFGCFIAALAQSRPRLLDFIDLQDPDGDVLLQLDSGEYNGRSSKSFG
jgi:hypothetical protein